MSLEHPKRALATLINFCSNDYPFLKHCIENALTFSEQVIISVCDHFFDGVPEDKEVLNQIYWEHPECEFVEFEYDSLKSYYALHGANYWHNLGRLLGFYCLKESVDYVLFLDTDEIIDQMRFKEWLCHFPLHNYDALRLSCYWYFREPYFQARTWEDSPLLVKKSLLNGDILMHPYEREGCYKEIGGNKKRHVDGLDACPLAHHYSWVRNKEQMLRKVTSWGQNWARNWRLLVEEEFSHPFTGRDFVYGYKYNQVTPFISLNLNDSPNKKGQRQMAQNVRKMNTNEINKIDLILRI